ncbi:UNVERIFIED_CONTAM: hypothetical protein Scaly_2671400 [Sesamum calycinum]|uniref:Uncharacterized protein n=1 Tax=Sesamum calycinum TaxID=2727403 RepID=A0AAW2J7T5_9LAMI
MCMSFEYMFLTMVIPNLSNPKCLIDVYMEPLIEELLQLWHVGVSTYDHATDRAFMMQVPLMWIMNELPAYGMASRKLPEYVWSALTEVSPLFQSICSTTLDVHKLHELENSVAIIMCTSQAKLYGQRATKCHYWGPSAKVTSFNTYFVYGYDFKTERHNTGKSTMNCGLREFSTIPSGLTVAYQPGEVVPVPIVAVDNPSYDLRDPNGLQVVLEAAGTSRRQLHENNNDNKDEDEDNGGDDVTDDEEYEAT